MSFSDLCVILCVKYYGGLLLGPKSFYKHREGEVEERCLHALAMQLQDFRQRGFFI